jgi:hypothetical protein
MTYVDAPGDKVRGWFDHTSDCSYLHIASVFSFDAESVRRTEFKSADELAAIAAQALANVAKGIILVEEDDA